MRKRSSGPREARPRIVIIGAGYAGYHCARGLERRLPAAAADIAIVSPTDYIPHLSLLPHARAGTAHPPHLPAPRSAAPGAVPVGPAAPCPPAPRPCHRR